MIITPLLLHKMSPWLVSFPSMYHYSLYPLMALLFLAAFPLLIHADCPVQPSYVPPLVLGGYSLQLVVKGLVTPRHIAFDSAGNLLVSGGRTGIVALVLEEKNGCVLVVNKVIVVESGDLDLYHGLSISKDGRTLYASSSEAAYSWSYDSSALTASSRRTLVTGMFSGGHITRTLLSSPSYPDILIISRGSEGNIDPGAADISTGRSQLKAFNVSALPNNASYDFGTDGIVLGWGLRNSVGVGEDSRGGLWTVENSADNITVKGVDIRQNNPAEEMNWHGYLNETLTQAGYVGPNYGYPTCLTTWDPADIPYPNLRAGIPFPLSPNNSCNSTRAPRLSFQAHTAPLDIKFHPLTSSAWITFHGSASREPPVGYKLSYIPFMPEGQPQAEADSMNAVIDVVWSPDLAACPGGGCTRPVGLAFDKNGRIWWSGDRGGEVWVLTPPGKPRTAVVTGAPVKSGGSKMGNVRVGAWFLGMVFGIVVGGHLW